MAKHARASPDPDRHAITVSMPSRESQTVKQEINVTGPTPLGDAVAATRRYAADQSLAAQDEARLCIIVEELLTNLIEHGGGIGQSINIELDRAGRAVTVVIEDTGPRFDPRMPPETDDIPARGGGAGLRLVRAWSKISGYETAGGRNRLKLSVPLSSD
jgi:anti-sigma regulatory factor (Ser/Thr protein kinase)